MDHLDLGDDLEGSAHGEGETQLGERFEAAADARLLPADALGDRLDLAAGRRDQCEDPVRLAIVEARQHDGVGHIAARGGHCGHGTPTRLPPNPLLPSRTFVPPGLHSRLLALSTSPDIAPLLAAT